MHFTTWQRVSASSADTSKCIQHLHRFSNMPHIVAQKVTFYSLKCHLLQRERQSFIKALIINQVTQHHKMALKLTVNKAQT